MITGGCDSVEEKRWRGEQKDGFQARSKAF